MRRKNLPFKIIIILGHSGFIGSYLTEYLRRRFCEKTDIIGLSSSAVDLTNEKDALKLKNLFDLQSIVIFCSVIKRQFNDDQPAFLKNLKMAMNVCSVLKTHPVRQFIFLSSAAVYGEDVHNTNITEETNVHPISYYGMAKYTSECLLSKIFERQKESSLLILRPPLVYGPGERVSTYGPGGFIKFALKGKKIILWGDGKEKREFFFIKDLAEIIYRLILKNYKGTLNIVSGKSYSFRELIKVIRWLVPFEGVVASRPRTKKKADNIFSNLVLKKALGGFDFTSLEDGIKETIAADRMLLNYAY